MNLRLGLLSMALGLIIFSCGNKEHHEKTAVGNDEWPEMDAFHMTMAEAFHPLKDSGNVEPAIRLMSQLADEADTWASAPIPEKVNNEEVKVKLEKLKIDLRELSNKVNSGVSKDSVGVALHTIHDQFHEIMEAWHGGEEKHEKEH